MGSRSIAPDAMDKIRKAFRLALHPNTGPAEQKAAWIGALRLCLAQGITTLDELAQAPTTEPEEDPYPPGWDMVMPFGKHKGMTLGAISMLYPDYLDWLRMQELKSRRLMDAVVQVFFWRRGHGTH